MNRLGIGAPRKVFLFLAAAVCLVVASGTLSRLATAEDGAAPAEKAAAAAEKPAAKEGSAKEPKTYFRWFLESSGFIGAVILLLSMYFIATVGRLFVEMRAVVAMPPELVEECEDLVQQRDFKSVYNAVKDDRSFFARVLTTGIAELPNGLGEARDTMERVGEAVTVEMEKKISMLAVLGTLGPMIGLLGTLKGMISSFSVIAISDVQLKASEVAGGISEALLLTFEGVALSVPAIYFFAVFRNRVSTISVTTMVRADQFLRHMAHAARANKAQAAAQAAPAAKPAAAT